MSDLYKNKYRIRSVRRDNYDYSQNGFYFVTICTKNREIFFGNIVDEDMELSELGLAANKFWLEIPRHFSFIKLDELIVMPNHVHGILQINNSVETQNLVSLHQQVGGYKNKFGPQSKNLSSVMRGFKIGVTKFVNDNNLIFGWQSGFYDRIIRDEDELSRIRQYIIDNPLK